MTFFEKHRLSVIAVLFLCALPLPVLFGGAPWHFYTAAVFLSIATGRAVWYWLQRTSKGLCVVLLVAFFAGLTIATVRGIDQELQGPNYPLWMSLVPRALEDQTLNDVPYVPQVAFYDTGSLGAFTWPFGGGGNLFKYLYRDPSITEIPVFHGVLVGPERAECKLIVGKRTLAFGFDVAHESWRVIHTNPCDGTRLP